MHPGVYSEQPTRKFPIPLTAILWPVDPVFHHAHRELVAYGFLRKGRRLAAWLRGRVAHYQPPDRANSDSHPHACELRALAQGQITQAHQSPIAATHGEDATAQESAIEVVVGL